MTKQTNSVDRLRDQKLEHALNEYTNNYDFWEAIDEKEVLKNILDFSKSDAVKQYHASGSVDLSKEQLINFHIEVMKIGLINEGDKKWSDDYVPKIREVAENYYNSLSNKPTDQKEEIERLRERVKYVEAEHHGANQRYRKYKDEMQQQLSDLQGKMESDLIIQKDLIKIVSKMGLLIDSKVQDDLGIRIDLGTVFNKSQVMSELDQLFKKHNLSDIYNLTQTKNGQ